MIVETIASVMKMDTIEPDSHHKYQNYWNWHYERKDSFIYTGTRKNMFHNKNKIHM